MATPLTQPSIETLACETLNNINDFVAITDADRGALGPVILFANEAFSRLTGYSATAGPSRVLEFLGMDGETESGIKHALDGNHPFEIEFQRHAGSEKKFWMKLNIIPLKAASDQVENLAWIQRDITPLTYKEQIIAALPGLDNVTGSYGVDYFKTVGRKECSRASRYATPLSLLLLDLDDFSSINDQLGHRGGDKVLRTFAAVCRAQLRDSDTFARYTGMKFAMLAPGVETREACLVAERIRKGTAAMGVRHRNEPIPVTVSVGVAGFCRDSDDLESFVRRANHALYDAKREGGNRIREAPAPKSSAGGPDGPRTSRRLTRRSDH